MTSQQILQIQRHNYRLSHQLEALGLPFTSLLNVRNRRGSVQRMTESNTLLQGPQQAFRRLDCHWNSLVCLVGKVCRGV